MGSLFLLGPVLHGIIQRRSGREILQHELLFVHLASQVFLFDISLLTDRCALRLVQASSFVMRHLAVLPGTAASRGAYHFVQLILDSLCGPDWSREDKRGHARGGVALAGRGVAG